MNVWLCNAHGLAEWKLSLPPTSSNSAHIILITETWAEAHSVLVLEGYTSYSLPRHYQKAARPSGGIAAFIRNDVSHLVSQWKPMHECTHMWLRVRSDIGIDADLYLCLFYLPPTHSTFYQNISEHLTTIARDTHTASQLGKVILAGDSNARTGTAPERLDCSEYADLDRFIPELSADILPPSTNLPVRNSMDPIVNSQGRALLEFCHECRISIVNGRVSGDLQGRVTCHNKNGKGCSLVDVFLAGQDVFPIISCLKVHELDASLRSDHCPLSLTLSLSNNSTLAAATKQHWIDKFMYDFSQESVRVYMQHIAEDERLSPSFLDSLPIPQACDALQKQIM